MRRFSRLNTTIAYPGILGVTTEKGQQDVKPNVLDAPTESYEIMLERWRTGVFEVGAPPPIEGNPTDITVDFVTFEGVDVFYNSGITPVTYRTEGA